jgi:MFS family permease
MLVSPILGTFLPVIGAKFMLIAGVFVAGVANILFGLLNYIESSDQFAIFCFLVRTFEALGAAAFSTASYTYIMNDFPDDIGTAFGFTETCMGLGMSLGPAVGAGLYTLGGYGLPFYVLGTMILLNIPLCWFLVEPIDMIASLKESEPQSSPDRSDNTNKAEETVVKRKRKSNYLTLVVIPEVAAVSVVVAVVSQSSGFLDPTLEPHFRQYQLGTNVVGFVFLAMSLAYAILAPIVGWIASKMDNTFPLMIVGLLVSAAGLVLLGPAWFLPLEPTVWLSFLAVVLMGFAHAIAFIPTFEAILDIALEKGFPDNVRTYSLVSGLWSSVYSLGEVTGPTFGGLFVDLYDFSNGCTIAAGFSLAAVSF